MKNSYLLILINCCIIVGGCEHKSFLYCGQTPPGDEPLIFAPGVISLPGRNEEVITFSPDGREIFYSVEYYPAPKPSFIMYLKYENGKWGTSDTASFSINRRTSEPSMAMNGTRVYYFANNVAGQKGLLDLCYSKKVNDTWSSPISLSSPPNIPAPGYSLHPCVVADTSVYFSANTGEICRSRYRSGRYSAVEKLPPPVNGKNLAGSECWGDPYTSEDESFMIFRSNRAGGFGGIDLYITFRNNDGGWSEPGNLGNKINTRFDELGGDITPDGKYMTFGRNGDIYWVSSDFIERMKQGVR